jgi:hypothetical protein
LDKVSSDGQTLDANTQKIVLLCRHFGGRRLLDVGFWYEEGPMNKLLLSTNQIARILCPLDQQQ